MSGDGFCAWVCVCMYVFVVSGESPPPPPPAHQSSILKWDDSDWWWRCETRCASRITCLSHSCLPLPCSRSWLTEEKTLFLAELEITGHSDHMWPGLFWESMVFKPSVRSAVCEGRVKCAFIKAYNENTVTVKISHAMTCTEEWPKFMVNLSWS